MYKDIKDFENRAEHEIHKSKVSGNIPFFKVVVDFMKKVIGNKELTQAQLNLISSLYDLKIDFRTLGKLKKYLYEFKSLQGNKIPTEDFNKMKV